MNDNNPGGQPKLAQNNSIEINDSIQRDDNRDDQRAEPSTPLINNDTSVDATMMQDYYDIVARIASENENQPVEMGNDFEKVVERDAEKDVEKDIEENIDKDAEKEVRSDDQPVEPSTSTVDEGASTARTNNHDRDSASAEPVTENENQSVEMNDHVKEEDNLGSQVSRPDVSMANHEVSAVLDINHDHDSMSAPAISQSEGQSEMGIDHREKDDLEPLAQSSDCTTSPRHHTDHVETNDSSSLFIPERGSTPSFSTPPPESRQLNPAQSLTPSRQLNNPPKSMYAKLREMQKANKTRKNAYGSHPAAHQLDANLDPEDYLNAVTPSTRAPTGAYAAAVDKDEMEHRSALAEFQRQKRAYEKIKEQHNGQLPFRQDVEWMKIQGEEDARLKKRQRDMIEAEEGNEQDPFPCVRIQAEETGNESDDGYYIGGSSSKRRRGNQPRKESEIVSMQEAELRSMRVALEANDDLPKKKKKGAAGLESDQDPLLAKDKTTKSKTKRPSRTKTAGKSTARGPRRTAKDKRELERATKQASSLFNADVFEQQAGMGAADQPVFRTRKKAEVLKELIASVPIQDHSHVRNDMNTLLQASRDFDGRASCKLAENGNWLVRGMRTSLKGYQVLGSAFMRRRENDMKEPKGGLMADQMGLGKTLMMLANIVNSRDAMIRTKEAGPRTTLLVASPALLSQWSSEIEQHTDCGMKVLKYSTGVRIDSNDTEGVLGSQDIVLTTYSEVMKSYPQNKPPIELQTSQEKDAWWKETYYRDRGVLHKMHFKRIVLDEAQAIKNHQARTSIACRALMATHKWALSGTPILNGLEELYPYFKFLGVPHTGSFKIFKQNYCGNGQGESAERLLVRLNQFMIRRTHADRMFNAPILKLPQATQFTYWCDFNSVERSIYNIVHQRFAANINKISRKGNLQNSYNNILTMLLRLRQLTGHVLMLQFVMIDLLERKDIEKIKGIVKEEAATSNFAQGRTILAIRKQLQAHEIREKRKAEAKAARRLAAEEAAREASRVAGTEYVEPEHNDEAYEYDEDDGPVGLPQDDEVEGEVCGASLGRERNKSGKSFGKSYNFSPFLNNLANGREWEKKKETAQCAECGRRPTNPWVTACGHLLCASCYEDVMATAAELGRSNGTCKACGTIFAACDKCDDEDDDFAGPSHGTRNRTAQQKKRDKERLDREDIADDWLSLGGNDVLPSAKTKAIKAQILNWVRDNPNVKIIIYTQFLAMIRILSKVCKQEEWESEQYHGKMSLGARDKAIKNFANDDKCRVLLASLRCGGLGLNLTMASKVIMIDPWWNQASEQQAFCRVFRIGQEDETFMSRMCVRNTVDERLIEMQKRKQKEIDNVMEDRGKKTKNLDIADLMRLFGNLEESDDGKPFIVVDNPIAAGGFHADSDHEGYANDL